MPILSFLIHLAGATMLLLFAVRMVRTGIERSYGDRFQVLLTQNRWPPRAALIGVMLAIVLQSSAAVTLLSAGFVGNGLLGFTTALAVVLGGDLGSAIVIRILSLDLAWLIPVLLAIGGTLFIKSTQRHWRQMGRILMGVAFILIALQFLREAMDPIRDSAFLPAIANYLAADFVTAFLVGAALAFVMHSSVAAILMCVTLVQIGAIPFAAGISLLLGANLGGALIPVWLSRGLTTPARRVPWANAILRGGWALLALLAVNLLPLGDLLHARGGAGLLIAVHVSFNAALLLLTLPILPLVERAAQRLMPEPDTTLPGLAPIAEPVSALDPDMLDQPTLALACLKRELLRMNGLVEAMFAPVLQIYDTGDPTRIRALRRADDQVNDCLSNIRDYVASITPGSWQKSERRAARDMVDYAIALESAGDLITRRFTTLAEELHQTGAQFSAEGWAEIAALHRRIVANQKLAGNVLVSDDLESARLLSQEKSELKRAERTSRKRHLKRLQQGMQESIETSDIHLETLMAFREFNNHISAVAFPILYANGQLLETRLIDDLPKAERQA
ncbi:Na/Pi cotransporter family protein [Roseovarius faecimaris]|uniref:Na/Pi cotransporter family protein n=1 Tax=Roseovarius faecimaris TaxID=2494550 RepID=A0A6I6IVI7_9RHOB|nr:Na/Pi cotransporter family protein [Roseovarius faecimaris]QGX99651.1 Na/Pi cotransporter family protein [Roseovarius faecimaris]